MRASQRRAMANQETKTLPEEAPMVGGDGPGSYYQNSSLQKAVMDAAKGKMKEGIMNKLDFKTPNSQSLNPFRIADFGCSVGPNTFFAVDNIIEAVNLKYGSNAAPLQFQVFFNDVTSNDFNTLFKYIPSPRKYFAAGVPGSFYGRLFPNSSLHIAHSCYALHWLSEVPKEVVDRNSAAWNKDNIYSRGSKKEVVEAYLKQYKKDMDAFLSARTEEIVEGGFLIILVAGSPDGVLPSQTSDAIVYSLLASSLVDLAKLGVINEEKVASFNLPLYHASPQELKEIIQSNGYFSIEDMEEIINPILQGNMPSPEYLVATMRAIFEGFFEKHFENKDEIDKIFQQFFKKLVDNHFMFDGVNVDPIDIFIILKRNTNRNANGCMVA